MSTFRIQSQLSQTIRKLSRIDDELQKKSLSRRQHIICRVKRFILSFRIWDLSAQLHTRSRQE